MSNGGVSLPAGNSSLDSTPLANPHSAGPPVTSLALASSNRPGSADQDMNEMSEPTSSGRPNGSTTAPTAPSSPTSQDRTPPDNPQLEPVSNGDYTIRVYMDEI